MNIAENYKMKNEMVYDYLYKAILSGELRPGQKIVIRDVGKRLDISDIPVRETIKILETQGLIEVVPHVGARVRKISLKELEEIFSSAQKPDPSSP